MHTDEAGQGNTCLGIAAGSVRDGTEISGRSLNGHSILPAMMPGYQMPAAKLARLACTVAECPESQRRQRPQRLL
jgi:hypothetical protein